MLDAVVRAARSLRPLVVAGALLAAGTSVAYGVAALRTVHAAVAEARAHDRELVAVVGDVAARDVPKAYDFLAGRFFGDPHYAGEPHWYPFATPLLAAIGTKLLGTSLHEAYFVVGAVMSALLVAAGGLFMWACGGAAGLLAFPLAIALGLFWGDNGIYPFQTARLPFVLFMALAGRAFARLGRPEASPGTALGLGALIGVLGLWHGASFVVASSVGAVLLGARVFQAWRRRVTPREVALEAALVVGTAATLFSLLVVPQLLRYGTLRDPTAARLYLEVYFRGGDAPGEASRLALLPRGADLPWVLAIGAALAWGRARRAPAAPLGVAYVVAKALAHLGFLVNASGHPALRAVARRLLVVPAHTLDAVGDFAFVLAKLWALAVAAEALGAIVARRRAGARPAVAGGAVLVAGLALLVAARFPAQQPPTGREVESWVVGCAIELSEVVEPGAAVYGMNGALAFAGLKTFWFDPEEHSNPYVFAERAAWDARLRAAVASGNAPLAAAILERFAVRYTEAGTPLARTLGAEEIVLPCGMFVARLGRTGL